MDNSATTPRIVPVTIPDDWCPKGSWAEIFNDFQLRFLAGAGVFVPGFGAVTPATIAQLQADILALQNQVTSLTKAYRSGSGTLTPSTATQTVPITFGTPMPTSNYDVGVMIFTNGGTHAAQSWHLDTAKATTGFTLRFNGTTSYNSFEWWVRER
jgi:hypothetical protein